MKRLLSVLFCIVLLAALLVPVFAQESTGQDASSETENLTTVTTTEIDMDGDGIHDYMDNMVDLDGDGTDDVDPVYQQPPQKSQLKKSNDSWLWAIIIVMFFAIIVSAVIIMIKQKKTQTTENDRSDEHVSDQ